MGNISNIFFWDAPSQCHSLTRVTPLISQTLIQGLATVCRGTTNDKIHFIFNMYDVSHDNTGTTSSSQHYCLVHLVWYYTTVTWRELIKSYAVSLPCNYCVPIRILTVMFGMVCSYFSVSKQELTTLLNHVPKELFHSPTAAVRR